MRAVVQRVSQASVLVDGATVSAIGQGLLVFVGVSAGDTEADVEYLATKIPELRIFEDADGKMNLSAREREVELLVVSQFTLLGDCRRGRRPSFEDAAPPSLAKALYDVLIARLAEVGLKVQTGVFRAKMDVRLSNDGPVTLLLDSTRQF